MDICIKTDAMTECTLQEYASEAGIDYVIDKAIEEMAELTQALIKFKINRGRDKWNTTAEFADVLVTLNTIKPYVTSNMLPTHAEVRMDKIRSHLDELLGESIYAK